MQSVPCAKFSQARFGAISTGEEIRGVREMIYNTINRLQRASVGTQHLASRYALLLQRLWRKGDPEFSPPDRSNSSVEGIVADAAQVNSLNNTIAAPNDASHLAYPHPPRPAFETNDMS